MSPRRVLIDARLIDGMPGGVQQIVLGLADGLGRLQDGDEEYLFLTYRGQGGWLRPYLKGACRELEGPEPPSRRRFWGLLPGPLRQALAGSRARTWLQPPRLAPAEPTVEASGVAVVHFPHQLAFRTGLPSIYQPQDLQHRHFPAFFTSYELRTRETLYRGYCAQAALVVMMSNHGKSDLAGELGVDPAKIAVIPGGSVLEAYERPSPEAVEAFHHRYRLPAAYFVYSAHTWPHKNHLRLLEAMGLLRAQGLVFYGVFPGRLTGHYRIIQKAARRLGLEGQCSFLGYLDPLGIQCVYARARAMVIPSLYEGWGLPLTEALHLGLPAAVASNSMLLEQAGGAALGFDPLDPRSIADALQKVMEDESLRRRLTEAGPVRAARFGWAKAARIFRAHYRRLAGWGLTDADETLIRRSFSDDPYGEAA